MEGVEDIPRAKHGVGGGEEGDAVRGELRRERGAPVEVLLRGYTGGELAGVEDVGVRFVNGLAKVIGCCGDCGVVSPSTWEADGRTRFRGGGGLASLPAWKEFSPS